jgi:hypothetical protein
MKKILLFSFILASFNISSFQLSPDITHLSWGKIETVNNENGIKQIFRDCKLYPGTAVEWDWKKTNTRHIPGIQVADIGEMINQVDIIILSKGMDEVLQVHPDTLAYLQYLKDEHLISEFYILQTEKAVALYNQLNNEGKKVGGVFHSTC